MSALLEIDDLTTGYSGSAVVRGLDLEVREGELVALFGPNGAGKTTTLLTTSGCIHPISGDIRFRGQSIRKKSPHLIARSGIGHVCEDRALFMSMTAGENLKLGQRKSGMPLGDTLSFMPALEGLLHRRAGLLSGGEQQMLSIARALVGAPSLLMVDELSLGLAPIVVERLLPMLRLAADESGLSVLLVEQHVHLAIEFVDRAYVLSAGELRFTGTATELKARPDLLEASYLGS